MWLWNRPNNDMLVTNGDLESLAKLLNSKEENQRRRSADGIGKLGRAEGIGYLMRAMVREKNSSVLNDLNRSVNMLISIPSSFSVLANLLIDENQELRLLAAQYLRKSLTNFQYGSIPTSTIDDLVMALSTSPQEVQTVAADALYLLGDFCVERLIFEVSNDKIYPIIILGRLKNPKALAPLVNRFIHKFRSDYQQFDDRWYKEVYIEAIKQIIDSHRDSIEAGEVLSSLVEILAGGNFPEVENAMAILPIFGDKVASPLVDLFNQACYRDDRESHNLRGKVAFVLSKIGWTPGNRQQTIWCLEGQEQYDRLVEYGTDAVPSLVNSFKSAPNYRWQYISKALAEIADPGSVRPLIALLNSPEHVPFILNTLVPILKKNLEQIASEDLGDITSIEGVRIISGYDEDDRPGKVIYVNNIPLLTQLRDITANELMRRKSES